MGLLGGCSATTNEGETSGGNTSSNGPPGGPGGPGPAGTGGYDESFGSVNPSGGVGGSGETTGGNQQTGESCDGRFTGRVRDFKEEHPDMEPQDSGKCVGCDDHDIVTDTLGPDLKPVYAGAADGTRSTTGKEAFDQWFRDIEGVNMPMNVTLQFEDPDNDGVWTYSDQEFFPIDNALFGNEGRQHNYHFTFEMHMGFEYKGGERFTFAGDDDVFTYINGKKVVDLGGVHVEQTEIVDLDDLGLEIGQTYQLDFFFAERHVTDSHFRIETSIEFINCGVEVK
ncbi:MULTISPECIES: fibro-slime domain-containing protein [Sorangium]|uniref:fibro-slime domain-containing protein n=1 Tax=Sorangium TaxID=39643 RepID=UPI00101A362C|nr:MULTISPECIES: fibro-slime domain-containing protein [Sorangium]